MRFLIGHSAQFNKLEIIMVHADISDLFFNADLSDAKTERNQFGEYGFVKEELESKAQDLLDSLRRLGVQSLPNSRELVKDFYERM